jgi:hypothetical protein
MTEIEQTRYQWYWHREDRGIGTSGGELLKKPGPNAGCCALKMRKTVREGRGGNWLRKACMRHLC